MCGGGRRENVLPLLSYGPCGSGSKGHRAEPCPCGSLWVCQLWGSGRWTGRQGSPANAVGQPHHHVTSGVLGINAGSRETEQEVDTTDTWEPSRTFQKQLEKTVMGQDEEVLPDPT